MKINALASAHDCAPCLKNGNCMCLEVFFFNYDAKLLQNGESFEAVS